MIEFFHVLTVFFEHGNFTANVSDLATCLDIGDQAMMEREYIESDLTGPMLGFNCISTETLSVTPMPELRP
jgi:hypothetical protein